MTFTHGLVWVCHQVQGVDAFEGSILLPSYQLAVICMSARF